MRLCSLIIAAGVLCSCATVPTNDQSIHLETVRMELEDGHLVLKAGTYASQSGFVFTIGYANSVSELGSPVSVGWTVSFRDYCRNRPSWVESVVVSPAGDTWRGYRVAVPPGPHRRQDWSSGSTGAEAYGGPATPGLLNAVEKGGRFTLALEDDTGRRYNAVMIDTLTLSQREALFQARRREDRLGQPERLMVSSVEPTERDPAPAVCAED